MKKIVILLALLQITGCSRILLPYHERYLCEKGYEAGYCGSIKQVYEQSLIEDKEKEKTEKCSCQKPLK